MNDMTKVTEPKSDQWNFDDFQGGPKTFTIESVRVKAGQDQPVEITLAGTPKFYRPCKSMSRCLVHAWGADSKKYAGRSLTLYGDPSIKWGGMCVGGIRISHMSHIESPLTMALTATKGSRKPYTVNPLIVTAPAKITAEEAAALETRCTENGIAVPKVKKAFGVSALTELTAGQLTEAHAMIESTLAARKSNETL